MGAGRMIYIIVIISGKTNHCELINKTMQTMVELENEKKTKNKLKVKAFLKACT